MRVLVAVVVGGTNMGADGGRMPIGGATGATLWGTGGTEAGLTGVGLKVTVTLQLTHYTQ